MSRINNFFRMPFFFRDLQTYVLSVIDKMLPVLFSEHFYSDVSIIHGCCSWYKLRSRCNFDLLVNYLIQRVEK